MKKLNSFYLLAHSSDQFTVILKEENMPMI